MSNTSNTSNRPDVSKNPNVIGDANKFQSSSESYKGKDSEGNLLYAKVMEKIHEIGDIIERAGEKVEKNGYSQIGKAIYKLGDKLEHLLEDSKFGKSENAEKSESQGADYASSGSASSSLNDKDKKSSSQTSWSKGH